MFSGFGYRSYYGPRDTERDAETEAGGDQMSGVGGLDGRRNMPSIAASQHANASVHMVDDQEKLRMNRILDGVDTPADPSDFESAVVAVAPGWSNGIEGSGGTPEGMCCECEDQPIQVNCENCCENFCEVCYEAIHRKGLRQRHTRVELVPSTALRRGHSSREKPEVADESRMVGVTHASTSLTAGFFSSALSFLSPSNLLGRGAPLTTPTAVAMMEAESLTAFINRCRYIPVRLSHEERKLLRLLQAACTVSEYTDRVDIVSYTSKGKRIHAQLKEMCAILSGLMVAADYQEGQRLIKDRNFSDNAGFFARVMEIGRRHKIMNPEKWRCEYGKLMYMLMDSQIGEIQDMMGFSLVAPVVTAHSFLESRGLSECLESSPFDLLATATSEILAGGKSRAQVQAEIKAKENAIKQLSRAWAKKSHGKLTEDDASMVLYSIGDNNSYLRFNYYPCEQMLNYLHEYFSSDGVESAEWSLGIAAGRDGARLTHNHSRQYHYVEQTLTLWGRILHNMYELWWRAENDMLHPDNDYRLCDTGQGLNRVQAAPRVSKLIHSILYSTQQSLGSENWIGSSVIHLGDRNVPNALNFIDKYNQVPRILMPIVSVLDRVDSVVRSDTALATYVNSRYGSVAALKKYILSDFFRHGFDGSGADNFFDAGSCIDGRLTSSWQWCSKIEKKPFYHIFLLCGFSGFDGEWN